MEHTTHTTRDARRPQAAVRTRVPRPAGRPAPRPGPRQRRRLPRPRLTGLGCGVLATVTMVAAARCCDLLGGAPTLYGVLFVAACVAAAVWVRPADLVCAPIAAPIAFATGLLASAGPADTVTQLALRAPWVFLGTLAAVAITLVRKGSDLLRRRLARRRGSGRVSR
ncbi:DUF6542 domain-containing protein [Streptomyces sp. MP131-18]|uniref:DUF6542 domain-containing protein n=1 Tax=Streptomyces sp. MP131-18 TaxID=1857892 RepID=UPI0015C53FD9|nr:DUF6542 domain-containing protein [Streptomyces sp. MP131-18]